MIRIFPNIEELNNFAAEKFVEIAVDVIKKYSEFNVALSGGSTPKLLYHLLSGEEFKNKIDWSQAFFFFGDERNVLPMDAESNFRMARKNLFEPLKIKNENIFRWRTELNDTEKIAENYAANLDAFFGDKILPRFDLVLLGMGADGHTASLFPFTQAIHETEKMAVANYVEKLKDWRFTLTFHVINNARNVMFLVAGEEKAETLKTVLEGEFEPEKYPAQNVRPHDGELFWLVDKKAAALLDFPQGSSS